MYKDILKEREDIRIVWVDGLKKEGTRTEDERKKCDYGKAQLQKMRR